MSSDKLKKRRTQLLCDLAEKTQGRRDVKLALSEVAPTLDIKGFSGGSKFVDRDNPVYEGGSDLAYDFSVLLEEGLIKSTHLTHKQDAGGGTIYINPAITITPAGFEVVSEAQTSWLTKSIDKQPMTFLQIIITIIIALITGLGGWIIGRYYTPATGNVSEISAPSSNSNSSNKSN